MKRKLYNLFTLASVLLLAGSVWWWTHSRQHVDQVTLHRHGGASVQVTGSEGKLMVTKALTEAASKPGGQLAWNSSMYDPSGKTSARFAATSFAYSSHPQNGTMLIVPVWALILGFAVLPGMWAWSKMKRKGGKKPAGA